MADVITFQRFWQRRDLAANWVSVNPVLASGEFGFEADTGFLKIGDGTTAWNSLDYVPVIASQVPYNNISSGLSATNVQDAIDEVAGGGAGGGINRFAEAYEGWDFIKEGVVTNSGTGTSFVVNGAVPVGYTSGIGSTATLSSATGAPGMVTLSTGTTTTGYLRLFLCPPVVRLGSGEISFRARIRIPTLSDATNRFSVGVVMVDVINGAPQRIAAVYTDNVNSGQWTADAIGSGTTTVNTTVAPTANTWMVLELRPNAAGTEWTLYIGSTSSSLSSAATVTSNLPTVALGLGIQITKMAGTTARTVEIDFCDFTQTFTSVR